MLNFSLITGKLYTLCLEFMYAIQNLWARIVFCSQILVYSVSLALCVSFGKERMTSKKQTRVYELVCGSWEGGVRRNLPWLKLSKSTFSSSLSRSLSSRGELPPFIERKYWLQRVLPASFFKRFSLARLKIQGTWISEMNAAIGCQHYCIAYRFWNHTCTTRISNPVSCDSCSRTCLAGFGLLL